MQKVQSCILLLIVFIFSKQELQNIKGHLKYQLSFMMNFVRVVQCQSIKCKKQNHRYCASMALSYSTGQR